MELFMFRVIIFLTALFSTGLVLASGWTGDYTVDKVMTEGTSTLVIIGVTTKEEKVSGCSKNGQWIFKADDADKRNRAYSTAMAALVSGKSIQLWFSDTCGAWDYHQATGIQLIN
jgi:hypothetical protein